MFPLFVAYVKNKSFYKWRKNINLPCNSNEPFETALRQILCVEPRSRVNVKKVLEKICVGRSEGKV